MAGQACQEQEATPENLRRSFELALKTREALDASGARVAILARAGQDLSRWGLSWSHAGLAWRDHPAGRWVVVHLLNQCGTAVSGLYNEGLANFFADAPLRWEALALIPDEAMQTRITAALASDLPLRLHQPSYSMVAYAFGTKYQNSNQWVIELLAAAQPEPQAMDRPQAHVWLKARDYKPASLNIPALTRLGGRMFRANVAFDDHPSEQRWADRIDTVTVESIDAFLGSQGAQRITIKDTP